LLFSCQDTASPYLCLPSRSLHRVDLRSIK
jgi:hypothetical protein